ncbi:MAG TPA: DUF1579 family protein [Candidatus Acidoferrum sp.]|jgi:hypothetical protein
MKNLAFCVVLLAGAFATALRPPAKTVFQASSARDEAVELTKTGENHKLLAQLVGTWTFRGKHFAPDVEFRGRLVRRPIWEGRYFLAETTGDKLVMPWSDGREVAYQDMTVEAYDNAKKKFASAMVDNHFDTGILLFEGSYDPATRTISYTNETEDSAGMKQKNWKLIRFVDKNHYIEEGYVEEKGSKTKVTELNYTRASE